MSYPVFKKNPPKSINGIINAGPNASAIVTDDAMQDIKYPV